MSETMIERVAKAICKSKTCEGFMCCQNPAQMGRLHCPVATGGYNDAANAVINALRVEEHIVALAEICELFGVPFSVSGKAPGGVVAWLEANVILKSQARKFIDSALSRDTHSLPTPAATPTDSANPPPVESVGPNSEAQ